MSEKHEKLKDEAVKYLIEERGFPKRWVRHKDWEN